MEFDEENPVEEQADGVEIYSKRAIWWFSVLASPLFGGALLLLNLKEAGYKKAIYPVLAFVVLFFLASEVLEAKFAIAYKVNFATPNKGSMTLCAIMLGANMIGGLVLTQYFFKKYFPEDDYYPKSILNPLLVTVIITILMKVLGA
jgi:hypothetical protein